MDAQRSVDAAPVRVPFIAPAFPPPEDVSRDYRAIVESNRFSNFGSFERRFRSSVAAYVASDAHAVTFSSATTALQAAILACVTGHPQGRFILMPSFTFAAAAQSVQVLGFRPYFIDIEIDGLHADPSEAERAIADRRPDIAAILFANSFGVGAHHISVWEEIAGSHGLPLVIDSAAGFGSRYEDGTHLGLRGDCEIFSFHATKPLAIGEGGAITTRDQELAERLRRTSNFGFDDAGTPAYAGLNGKLAELPAAIGLRQLLVLDAVIKRRAGILAEYRRTIPSVKFARNSERSSLAFVSTLLPDEVDQDRVIRRLGGRGIEARKYYAPALHRSRHFAGPHGDLPRTENVEHRVLSLPCHDGVTSAVVQEVVDVITIERS